MHAHLHVLDHREVLVRARAQPLVARLVDEQLRKRGLARRELLAHRGHLAGKGGQLCAELGQLVARARRRRLDRVAITFQVLCSLRLRGRGRTAQRLVLLLEPADDFGVTPALLSLRALELRGSRRPSE